MESEVKASLSLQEWNHQVLMLMQSLLGTISSNFRMVSIGHDGRRWQLRFFLEKEEKIDREEISEIALQFEAFQETGIDYDVEIHVTQEPLEWPLAPERVVFRRR